MRGLRGSWTLFSQTPATLRAGRGLATHGGGRSMGGWLGVYSKLRVEVEGKDKDQGDCGLRFHKAQGLCALVSVPFCHILGRVRQ